MPKLETNLIRNYHKGDTFYIPQSLMEMNEKELFDEFGIEDISLLRAGTEIIFMEDSTKVFFSDDLSPVKVELIYPDGKRMVGNISACLLCVLPLDRRYGRKLGGLDIVRAREICGIVYEERKDCELVFRKKDTKAQINQLRLEAIKIVYPSILE